MKIQLERNLKSASGKSRCIVCERTSDLDRLRTLLCRDNGSIVGDICTDCTHQTTSYIQKRLYQRAVKLINQPISTVDQTSSPQKQALELSELAHQKLIRPSIYDWWWKGWEIWSAEIGEFKLFQNPTKSSQLRDINDLKISLLKDQPSIGKDN